MHNLLTIQGVIIIRKVRESNLRSSAREESGARFCQFARDLGRAKADGGTKGLVDDELTCGHSYLDYAEDVHLVLWRIQVAGDEDFSSLISISQHEKISELRRRAENPPCTT